MTEEMTYHIPVLLKESIDGMNIRPDGTYVDVTFGGGGHSQYILSKLGDTGRLLGSLLSEAISDTYITSYATNMRKK